MVYVIATLAANGVDVLNSRYKVGVNGVIVPDTPPDFTIGLTIEVSVPFGSNDRQADKLIRQATAAYILAQYSYTISPDDIYFPKAL